MLSALEGAIQGIRWHSLSDEVKQELSIFHKLPRDENITKIISYKNTKLTK